MYEKLGSAYYCLGDYKQAITHLSQSLIIAKEMGERVTEGDMYHQLGLAYSCLDDNEAIARLYQSLIIAKETAKRAKEARGSNNLGRAYHDIGDYTQAIVYF